MLNARTGLNIFSGCVFCFQTGNENFKRSGELKSLETFVKNHLKCHSYVRGNLKLIVNFRFCIKCGMTDLDNPRFFQRFALIFPELESKFLFS